MIEVYQYKLSFTDQGLMYQRSNVYIHIHIYMIGMLLNFCDDRNHLGNLFLNRPSLDLLK